jgi:thioredoxin 1
MATVQVTEETFKETVQNGIVLIDFWAAWCGPCRMFAPVFEEASNRHPDVVFAKVDTDAEQNLAAGFQIQSIPTLAVLRDGILLGSQPGVMPPEVIDDVIRQVKELDMDAVRREIEAELAARAAGADSPASTG